MLSVLMTVALFQNLQHKTLHFNLSPQIKTFFEEISDYLIADKLTAALAW